MKSLKIEPFNMKYQTALAKIFYQIRREDFPWVNQELFSLADFAEQVAGEKIFVALFHDRPVGFISVWVPDLFIHHLYVDKDHRGIGIGKALIECAAVAFGNSLTLKCVKENPSVYFYLANGWKIVEEAIGVEGPYYLMLME